MTKCPHSHLQIFRTIKIGHTSDIQFKKNEDNESEINELNWQDASEWDINPFETDDAEIKCMDCKRKWSGKVHPANNNPYNEFPNWLQERLDLEDSYFKDLL